MGVSECVRSRTIAEERLHRQALDHDISALEHMLDSGMLDNTCRVGAEQELFLVDSALRPAPVAQAILKGVTDKRLAPELASFNLEANASPRRLEGACLRQLETELLQLVALARRQAQRLGKQVVLAGVLPTLRQDDLGLAHLSPLPRCTHLNEAFTARNGGTFRVAIEGDDPLETAHDNLMLESATTSFQLHYQVPPAQFTDLYNLSQLIAAPLIAVAANSPMFLGHRLWRETRIPLFHNALDGRRRAAQRQDPPRAIFGEEWIRGSALELFRQQAESHPVLLGSAQAEDSLGLVASGEVPKLQALCTHNGTVYRWNRPCYGIFEGRPHLRIEHRGLPAGPTIRDQIANAALFFGLMHFHQAEGSAVHERIPFQAAKTNFYHAARHGLDAQLLWLDGKTIAVADLLLERLIPQARAGLVMAGVERRDIDEYLDVLVERINTKQTGASWMLESLAAMNPSKVDCAHIITAAMLKNQRSDIPVSRWALASADDTTWTDF